MLDMLTAYPILGIQLIELDGLEMIPVGEGLVNKIKRKSVFYLTCEILCVMLYASRFVFNGSKGNYRYSIKYGYWKLLLRIVLL